MIFLGLERLPSIRVMRVVYSLRGRIKPRRVARDHVKILRLKSSRCADDARGDDGVVIAHLGVVEDAQVGLTHSLRVFSA